MNDRMSDFQLVADTIAQRPGADEKLLSRLEACRDDARSKAGRKVFILMANDDPRDAFMTAEAANRERDDLQRGEDKVYAGSNYVKIHYHVHEVPLIEE